MNICLFCNKPLDRKEPIYGLHRECMCSWFKLTEPLEFRELVAKEGSVEGTFPQKFSKFNSSFFQGKFKKYSAELGKFSYILKVQQGDYLELPATEYLCNQIARLLKIKVAEYILIDFHRYPTFVARNFIKTQRKQNLIHIYHFLSSDKDFNCENLIEIIKQKTGLLKEVDRFIELCLFDSLIGNHDRHGRNLAFIQTPNKFSLSPFYDNPSYIGIELESLLGAQHSPRGKIVTALTMEPTIKDYVKEFYRLSYKDVVKKFYSKIQLTSIENIIKNSFISTKRKEALLRLISERYLELKNVI